MIDKNLGAEREVIGTKKGVGSNNTFAGNNGISENQEFATEYNETVPSTNIAKKYDGYKYSISPMKQTNETIMIFHKPYKTGSCLHDTLDYENGDTTCTCGALNIDGNRCSYDVKDTNPATNPKYRFENGYKIPEKGKESNGAIDFTSSKNEINLEGRYPAQTYCDTQTAEVLDRQSGIDNIKGNTYNYSGLKEYGEDGFINNIKPNSPSNYGDTGGCSKILHKCDFEENEHDLYFYCPKVNKSERNAGCDEFEEKTKYWHDMDNTGKNPDNPKNYLGGKITQQIAKNTHPTLKPISLNEKILKLFKTPNIQKICYSFSGSGSEIIGGIKAGFENWYACEINNKYIDISNARIQYWNKKYIEEKSQVSMFEETVKIKTEQNSLFGDE
ncbi:MAG: hypothetical protein M0R51_09425 [Clostridia bacterium]|jgi:hypothetical protein|nr:hypothetical protein [Clostridia bacterium]